MKIAVLGAGAIGLYYGARLAADGHHVHFLLRSGYDEARREGIRVFSPDGDLHLSPVNAHRSVLEIGPCDLVLIALKTTQNAALTDLIPPLLRPNTRLLTLQNGLGSDEWLAQRFGADRVLGALCFVCLTRRSPAQVDHFGHGTISVGEFSRPSTRRTAEIVSLFESAGIESRVVDQLAGERWKKLVWNIPFNGLAVAEGGITVDRILRDHLNEVRALMEETIAAAEAHGHSITRDFIDFQIDRTHAMGAYRPSTLVDYLAGQELEIEAIWGEPRQRARKAGVAVPRLDDLHARLVAIEKSRGR